MSKPAAEQNPPVCRLLRVGESFIGKQGFSYAPAISAETVASSGW